MDVPAAEMGQVVTITVPVALSNRSPASDGTIFLNFPDTAESASFTAEVPVVLNRDLVPASSASEFFTEPELKWTVDGTVDGEPGWKRVGQSMQAESANGVSDVSLVSPDLVVGTGDFRIAISHRYMFDSDSAGNRYDGGVVELSADGGTWTDIGESIYNGTLVPGANPLAGRRAVTGLNDAYGAFEPATIDLGTAYAEKTVKIRFRAGTDDLLGWGGWNIDSVVFDGLTNTPFDALVSDPVDDANTCGNLGASSGASGKKGCATGGDVSAAASLLAMAALALRLRRRRAR